MSFEIDDKIIHDDEAMWRLALSFKCRYDFVRKQIIQSETKNSIIYEGKIIMKWEKEYKEYKEILSNYKKEIDFLNHIIEFEYERENSSLKKYVKIDEQ